MIPGAKGPRLDRRRNAMPARPAPSAPNDQSGMGTLVLLLDSAKAPAPEGDVVALPEINIGASWQLRSRSRESLGHGVA
jgi:hypothetical protein